MRASCVFYAGKLHLVDLAGSERISKSGAAGKALKEAQVMITCSGRDDAKACRGCCFVCDLVENQKDNGDSVAAGVPCLFPVVLLHL